MICKILYKENLVFVAGNDSVRYSLLNPKVINELTETRDDQANVTETNLMA